MRFALDEGPGACDFVVPDVVQVDNHDVMNLSSCLMLLIVASQQFQVVVEVLSQATQRFEWAEIESIDRRFVDYTSIDLNGRFVFKKIPEGLYKLTTVGAGGLQQQRTIEVRPAFADARGLVSVKIEIKGRPLPQDRLKVGLARLAVSPKAVDELRRAYEARGNVEKARRHLQKAIEMSPDFDEALNNLGTYYYRDGRFETAANLFQRALSANPDSFHAQVNLGGALLSLGEYPRALEENLKAIGMRADDSLAQAQTGQSLFYLKRYDEALPHLEKARQLDPLLFALPGLFIAQIRHIQGNRESAIAEYKEFLRIHPGHPNTAFVEAQLRQLSVTLEQPSDR